MAMTYARSPEDVKAWIEANPHHWGRSLDRNKRELHDMKDKPAYLQLGGKEQLMIPVDVLRKCFITPYGAPDDRLYIWDEIEEKAAEDFDSYVITDDNTFDLPMEDGFKRVGSVRGILKEVFYIHDAEEKAHAYYLIHGMSGKYAMKAEGKYTVIPYDDLTALEKEQMLAKGK